MHFRRVVVGQNIFKKIDNVALYRFIRHVPLARKFIVRKFFNFYPSKVARPHQTLHRIATLYTFYKQQPYIDPLITRNSQRLYLKNTLHVHPDYKSFR